jgi:HAD superfamily hydrolase (TIGR01509 family)
MKAVIFDMDGVIIDSQSIADTLLAQTAKKFGVHLSEQELHNMHGIPFEIFWQQIKEKYNLPETAEFYGDHYDVEKEIRLYHKLMPIKGISQLLEDLKAHNIPLALATSASRYRMLKVLDIFELRETFAAMVTKDDVTHAKPDPEIFIKAAEKLHIPNKECIVIEDAIHGLKAARLAGMKCVLYWNKTTPVDPSIKPDLLTKDLSEIDYRILSKL